MSRVLSIESGEFRGEWVPLARAEQAEAERDSLQQACDSFSGRANRLDKENRELKAEVERLKGYVQSVIDWNNDRSITMDQFCGKLDEAEGYLKAQKEGNDEPR